MGRRGPAPEPLEAKLARGETRPSRINKVVGPKPRLAEPFMPRDMSERAKTVWRAVIRDQAPGLIRAIDAPLLRTFCEAVVRYEGAMHLYSSPLITTRGSVVANPLSRIIRAESDLIRLLARELGIGAAARAGMSIVDFGEPAGVSSIEDEIGPSPRARFRVVGGSDAE